MESRNRNNWRSSMFFSWGGDHTLVKEGTPEVY